MADHKIQLTLAGKYTGGKQLKQAHSDVKGMQGAVRECSEVSKHALGQMAGYFGGELSGTIRTTIGLVEELGKGGLWGLLAAGANLAVKAIVDYFKKAEEQAKAFGRACSEYVAESLNGVSGRFNETATAAKTASDAVKELFSVASGDVARSAEMKVHELHISTLQRITDDMSAAAVNSIKAEEAYAAAKIKGEAAVTSAQLATSAIEADLMEAQKRRVAAESKLEEVASLRATAEEQLSDTDGYTKYIVARQTLTAAMENTAASEAERAEIEKAAKEAAVVVEAFEKEHGEALSALNQAIKAESESTAAITAAKKEIESLEQKVATSISQEGLVRSRLAASLADLEKQVDASRLAIEKENAEAAARAEQESLAALTAEERLQVQEASMRIERVCQARLVDKAHFLDLYNGLHEEGLTNEEAYNVMQSRLNEMLRGRDEIEQYCADLGMEHAEIIEHYNQCMYNGMTQTEAYASTMEKLNAAIEKRADAEKKAADGAGGSGSGGKDGKDGKGGTKGKPLYVSLSSSISDEIGKTGGKTWSETQKTARKQHNEMLKDALPLYRAMKGQMPKDQQKLFEKYMMSKYTPDQVKKIWDEAQSKQLIDKAERKRQTKYLEDMVKAMKEQMLD
jgi:hypothetical protein